MVRQGKRRVEVTRGKARQTECSRVRKQLTADKGLRAAGAG